MIVVDTNVIAVLLIGGPETPHVRRALKADPEWAAPLLWRSEFRSVLSHYLRRGSLSRALALEFMRTAETLLRKAEYQVESTAVMALVSASKCSAYDCEFVALARDLGVPLVTTDRQILEEFPDTAVSLRSYSK